MCTIAYLFGFMCRAFDIGCAFAFTLDVCIFLVPGSCW